MTFDGSLAKGRNMVADFAKLTLRAYNAEADNCVRSLRSGNVTTAQKRLESAVKAITELVSARACRTMSSAASTSLRRDKTTLASP